jgi:dGTPase
MTTEPQMEYLDALAHVRTPGALSWTDRRHQTESEADLRPAFERHRARLIHIEYHCRLRHKTQVIIVTEGDLFSTGPLHSVETGQVGRPPARGLGLNGALAQAICLPHDVGHVPFGRQGRHRLPGLYPTRLPQA